MNQAVSTSSTAPRHDVGLLTPEDYHLFNEGNHFRLYHKVGAHVCEFDGQRGTCFSVWAPGAEQVTVMGDFNNWDKRSHPLHSRAQSGLWEVFVPGVSEGTAYKFHILSRYNNYRVDKADPMGYRCEKAAGGAGSVVWNLDYQWGDDDWMARRKQHQAADAPISIYEVHLGSWRRAVEDNNRYLNYRELAPLLADYVKKMGFTHVEFLPITEHPYYPSWGYQVTGFFAPTSRYGDPQDLMYLIDYLHQQGIGVILDWVPSHFPTDEHGLKFFDGTHLYEHEDERLGMHRDWNTAVFNYGRNEVRSFLISNALFWLDKYHIDGLRVDAVASMLYLDYSRKEGEWVPNKYGGRENLDAIYFLRKFNETVYGEYPDTQTFAEESTDWPMVSRPTYVGGLGFGFKWDMGWMHDTLKYLAHEPVYRKYHQGGLTFRMVYAFNENFALSLSHDEVVHGKGSLLRKMPGDDWQRCANLRLLFGYMFSQPGKKLLFMGGEFGQWNEWYHEQSLDWHLLSQPLHEGVRQWVEDLNRTYRELPALYQKDHDPDGFEWIDFTDADNSIIAYLRQGYNDRDQVVVVCNFTPVPRLRYRIGVPRPGFWREALNSDAEVYGGSGMGNFGGLEADDYPFHDQPYSVSLTLPPLGVVVLHSNG